MRVGLAGLVPLVGRIADAVSDVLMGRLSDRTTWKAGRRRPYLLIGAIPFALSFAAIWAAPPIESAGARVRLLRRHVRVDQPLHDGRGGALPRAASRADRRLPRADVARDLSLGRLDPGNPLHARRLPAPRECARGRRARLADRGGRARRLDRAALVADLARDLRAPDVLRGGPGLDPGVFPAPLPQPELPPPDRPLHPRPHRHRPADGALPPLLHLRDRAAGRFRDRDGRVPRLRRRRDARLASLRARARQGDGLPLRLHRLGLRARVSVLHPAGVALRDHLRRDDARRHRLFGGRHDPLVDGGRRGGRGRARPRASAARGSTSGSSPSCARSRARSASPAPSSSSISRASGPATRTTRRSSGRCGR